MAIRRRLHARGMRYRVAYRPLSENRRTTVDIAFPRAKVAVLIDGCFWHGCPQHYREPQTHTDYWQAKIAGNSARDTRTTQALQDAGWQVLRFWSHQPPDEVVSEVEQAVRKALARL
jgi:DNA mismatch endonuclease (patch repair protein)